jgi:hypothetical protein
MQFHRFLELLKDYQVPVLKRRQHSHIVLTSLSKALNITAIHKSVKKFEKTTAKWTKVLKDNGVQYERSG